jgi:hypothetical protein
MLSLALLAMNGVTADQAVRAYHLSLFVGYMYAVPQLFVSWDGEKVIVSRRHMVISDYYVND